MFRAALSPLRRHVFYIRPFQRNFLLPSSHGAQLSESVVPVFEVAADGALTPGTRTLGSLQHDSRVSFRDLLEIEQPPSSSSRPARPAAGIDRGSLDVSFMAFSIPCA